MNKKNILIISHCFFPETMPINDVCNILSKNDYKIDVLTGKPNYPLGKIFKGYKMLGFQNETHSSGANIYRVPIIPRFNNSRIVILLNYFSFIFFASMYVFSKKFKKKKYNKILVFATSPVIQSIVGIIFKLKLKTKLVIWVQDLWPNSVLLSGYIKNDLILKIITKIIKKIYIYSDIILVQSPDFINEVKKIYNHKKVIYCPNPAHTFINKINKNFENKIKFQKGFNYLYAGNFGKMQSLEILVKAANKYYEINKNINFNLVGDGNIKKKLEELILKNNIKNVFLHDRLPQAKMKSLYDQADILIISLQKNSIISKTIPGKLQTYLSISKPILCFADGISKKIVNTANCGLVCDEDNISKLVDVFKKFEKLSNKKLNELGQNSLKYYKTNFDDKIVYKNLNDVI